ncbi:type II 3-dehydroquinate dehydratase [Roseibium sp.]|uniref:type II 3-dehydroquinate dehydratase n=1 Tax=Roseibium sp. TaxID=1936156 RepID=UPI003A978C8D
MKRHILILNGPNLNRLGRREPEIYGTTTLADVEAMCVAAAHGNEITFRQSNREYEIIDWVHEGIDTADAIIINPAAFTFYSIAIVDALKMFKGPIVELHISNVHSREAMYHNSLVSPYATAVMAGFGARGYLLAIEAVLDMLDPGAETAEK